jgi:hypothetical protein
MEAKAFATGEAESMNTAGPSISSETMGASYNVKVANPGPPSPDPLSEPYLMPTVHGRNGSMEKVDPAIVQTPLGGMMPGPLAIAPAIVPPTGWTQPVPDEEHGWYAGVGDSFPEGCPVPLR